jgi:hypothetical protein
MHVCPRSTPSPYIIGQPPAITLMPRRSQYSTARAETLVPRFLVGSRVDPEKGVSEIRLVSGLVDRLREKRSTVR